MFTFDHMRQAESLIAQIKLAMIGKSPAALTLACASIIAESELQTKAPQSVFDEALRTARAIGPHIIKP